ncbi:MAG: DNA recombination protein RmuC [Acidimicrobiales bacterium]
MVILIALVLGVALGAAVLVVALVVVPTASRRAVDAVDQQVERRLAAGSREVDVRNQAIQQQMADVSSHLRHVTDLVARFQADGAAQRGELMARIQETRHVTEVLARSTEGLQRALANPQARGQWGERMADDVLRAAGFIEGVNYRKQHTLPDGSRPDVTFLLPDDRLLHMDVKFPLAAYLRWCEAGTDKERASAVAEFLRDARHRVKELAKPSYADDSTVGFVLLFIPNESVYGFIHTHDGRFADEAIARRVVLCSPFTLFAVLGVIRQAVDAMALQRGADEILDVLGGFSHQWDQFTDKLDALGRNLQTVQNSYDALNGPRRRQLERQLDRVDDIKRQRGLDPPEPGVSSAPMGAVSATGSDRRLA